MALTIESQFQPGFPTSSHWSYSAAAPLSQAIRLMADEPPTTLPLVMASTRPLRWGCGTVVKFQSRRVPSVLPLRPGTLTPRSSGAAGPASTTRTRAAGSPRLRRAASALPAVPPPTMICRDGQHRGHERA